jgi:hypothetical protein
MMHDLRLTIMQEADCPVELPGVLTHGDGATDTMSFFSFGRLDTEIFTAVLASRSSC